MRHIVHIIPTLNFGGAERFVIELVNNSSDTFRHTIVTLFDELPLRPTLKDDTDVVVVPKRGKLSLHLFEDLRKKLLELRPDVVHTHLFGGDVWGRTAAKKLSIPVVTTEHNINTAEGFVKRTVKRHLRNSSDAYTAPSDAVTAYMKKVYSVTKEINVIRHGINLDAFNDIPEPRFEAPLKLLMLGRLTKQKGQDIALQALSDLQGLDWTLNIVGDGPSRFALEHIVDVQRLGEHVRFENATTDVTSVYGQHDIVLMPSRWEGLGLVAMEAMASGRLVIASRVDGLQEFIEHEKTGLLVEPNNADALREEIERCLKDRERSVRIAAAGKVFAQSNFGIQEVVKKYEEIYLALSDKT